MDLRECIKFIWDQGLVAGSCNHINEASSWIKVRKYDKGLLCLYDYYFISKITHTENNYYNSLFFFCKTVILSEHLSQYTDQATSWTSRVRFWAVQRVLFSHGVQTCVELERCKFQRITPLCVRTGLANALLFSEEDNICKYSFITKYLGFQNQDLCN